MGPCGAGSAGTGWSADRENAPWHPARSRGTGGGVQESARFDLERRAAAGDHEARARPGRLVLLLGLLLLFCVLDRRLVSGCTRHGLIRVPHRHADEIRSRKSHPRCDQRDDRHEDDRSRSQTGEAPETPIARHTRAGARAWCEHGHRTAGSHDQRRAKGAHRRDVSHTLVGRKASCLVPSHVCSAKTDYTSGFRGHARW